MEEQPVVLFLGIVGDVAVGIILAAHGFCNRLPMVLGDLMAAELGEGFRFLFVDFAMQLLAVFRGFLDFPFLLEAVWEIPAVSCPKVHPCRQPYRPYGTQRQSR